jgi:hypothetical protein
MEGNGGALRFSAFTTELRLFNYFYESCFNYFTNLQLRAPRTTPTGADAVDDRVGAKGWRLSLSLSLSIADKSPPVVDTTRFLETLLFSRHRRLIEREDHENALVPRRFYRGT